MLQVLVHCHPPTLPQLHLQSDSSSDWAGVHGEPASTWLPQPCSLPCPQGGAVSYTAFTPALGLAMDRGLGQETVILSGSLVLLARSPPTPFLTGWHSCPPSYLVLGPLPPLTSLLPPSYWWTVTSVVLQVTTHHPSPQCDGLAAALHTYSVH